MPRRTTHPETRPSLAFIALLATLLMAPHAPSLASQLDPAPPTPFEQLVDLAATPEQRLAAANQILQNTQDAATLNHTLALLNSDPTGGEAARTLLFALSGLSQAPNGFLAPLLTIARDPASPLRLDAVRALCACRSREAAAALIELTSDTQPPPIRDAAFLSLGQLTGRDDLGADPEAWREWLARSVGLSERQWEQDLLLAQSRRVQRLESSLDDTERRLVDAWRQIHLLTPVEGRSAVLVRLLTQDSPVLRDLGFELVNREISENRALQPAVSQAAIDLLRSSDPLIRAQAALVINRLVPPEAQAHVLTALNAEADPRAADALLQAASRWPSPSAVRPALRWLEHTSPSLRLRAAGLAWALYRAGLLEGADDRAAVLHAVRSLDTASLTGPACRLLASFGNASDLARIQGLLESPEPAIRATAADALGLRADQMDALLAAAADDPSIFEAVAKAARTHLHDARGYSALARLPAPSPQIRSRVLVEYAAVLSTEELVRLAKRNEPADALPLLNPLIAPERLAASDQLPQLAEGLLLLTQANIAVGNPGDALNALSLIPESQPPASPEELTDLRVVLLLWLNRIEQAEEFDASPDAWLEALEHALTEPHAPIIAQRLEDRFGASLSAEHRDRLSRLRQKVAEAETAATEEGG